MSTFKEQEKDLLNLYIDENIYTVYKRKHFRKHYTRKR